MKRFVSLALCVAIIAVVSIAGFGCSSSTGTTAPLAPTDVVVPESTAPVTPQQTEAATVPPVTPDATVLPVPELSPAGEDTGAGVLTQTGGITAGRLMANQAYTGDNDGDGQYDSTEIIYIEADAQENKLIAVKYTDDAGSSSQVEVRGQAFFTAYDYRDAEGNGFVLISGDYGNGNFETNVIALGASIKIIDTIYGALADVIDGLVYMSDSIELVGFNFATRPYFLTADGLLPIEGSFWTYTNDVALTTAKELTFEKLVEGEYKKETVPAGTVVHAVSTDRDSILNIRLDDGSMGIIEFVSADDGSVLINGVAESEIFEIAG